MATPSRVAGQGILEQPTAVQMTPLGCWRKRPCADSGYKQCRPGEDPSGVNSAEELEVGNTPRQRCQSENVAMVCLHISLEASRVECTWWIVVAKKLRHAYALQCV